MTEQKNTPAIIAAKTAVALTEQRSSLVARGLVAVMRNSICNTLINGDANCAEHQFQLGELYWKRYISESPSHYTPRQMRDELPRQPGETKKKYHKRFNLYLSEKGFTPEKHINEAEKWFKLAAAQGHAVAQCRLGDCYSDNGDFPEAVKWYRLSADQGNLRAQLVLGMRFFSGDNVPQDYKEAQKWSLLAAEQGHGRSQYHLGWMYEHGKGVPQNFDEAAMWYAGDYYKAHARTQAEMESKKNFAEQRYKEAARLYLPLAERGNPSAQWHLGYIHERGEIVPKDIEEAKRWYRLAAEQGHAGAQWELGWMYGHGQGVYRDHKEAMKWYRLAAEQGRADAQWELGQIYEKGQGVPQDYEEAMKWYQLSAAQDYPSAQFKLGEMYQDGEGVSQDYEEAAKWYRKAAEAFDVANEERMSAMAQRALHELGVIGKNNAS